MLQWTLQSRELIGTDSEYDKAFERTGSDHVIHNPDAIRARFVGPIADLIESNSQQVVMLVPGIFGGSSSSPPMGAGASIW